MYRRDPQTVRPTTAAVHADSKFADVVTIASRRVVTVGSVEAIQSVWDLHVVEAFT